MTHADGRLRDQLVRRCDVLRAVEQVVFKTSQPAEAVIRICYGRDDCSESAFYTLTKEWRRPRSYVRRRLLEGWREVFNSLSDPAASGEGSS